MGGPSLDRFAHCVSNNAGSFGVVAEIKPLFPGGQASLVCQPITALGQPFEISLSGFLFADGEVAMFFGRDYSIGCCSRMIGFLRTR